MTSTLLVLAATIAIGHSYAGLQSSPPATPPPSSPAPDASDEVIVHDDPPVQHEEIILIEEEFDGPSLCDAFPNSRLCS